MKRYGLGVLASAALCSSAWATDFGVMETAEPIEPQSFKLVGFPLMSDRDGSDDQGAIALGLGYGLGNGLDVEVLAARSDIATTLGADLEWNAWTADRVRLSLAGGLHGADLDAGGSARGLDATAIFTFTPMDRLDLNAAFDGSFEDVSGGANADPGLPQRWRTDNEFETAYVVPGVEYQLTHNLDLLAEGGLGLNNESDDYLSAGLSWYFR